MEDGSKEDNNLNDILSAALFEAGVDEFFQFPPPNSEQNVAPKNEGQFSGPSVVVSEETVGQSNIGNIELASPSTASNGNSPDLPVEATHAQLPTTSAQISSSSSFISSTTNRNGNNNNKIESFTSSPGITARAVVPPDAANSPGQARRRLANGPVTGSAVGGANPQRFPAPKTNQPITKYIKLVNSEGKTFIVPLPSSNSASTASNLAIGANSSGLANPANQKTTLVPAGTSLAKTNFRFVLANQRMPTSTAAALSSSSIVAPPSFMMSSPSLMTSSQLVTSSSSLMTSSQKILIKNTIAQSPSTTTGVVRPIIGQQSRDVSKIAGQTTRFVPRPPSMMAQTVRPNVPWAPTAPPIRNPSMIGQQSRAPPVRNLAPSTATTKMTRDAIRTPAPVTSSTKANVQSRDLGSRKVTQAMMASNQQQPPVLQPSRDPLIRNPMTSMSAPSLQQQSRDAAAARSSPGLTNRASPLPRAAWNMPPQQSRDPPRNSLAANFAPQSRDSPPNVNPAASAEEGEEEEEEELSHADTYSDYRPAKLKSGLPHPDPVVETSSLSSVPPPDIYYHVRIPEHIIDTGKLSALQLEAIIYACQQHENSNSNGERLGYLVGDGAGVGKGRTIAGLIFENYLLGRKRALWFSVSSDLKYDAERDLADIGADRIKVHALNKFKYSKISGKENGGVKKGVIFATYSSLIGESSNAKSKYRTRLKQLIHWCGGKDFEGLIIFDECHRAKNLVPTGNSKPTKTGQTVLELQKALPRGRVVYASATGATETRNMAYMTRLGLWGPNKQFRDFQEYINAVEKRGVGAMEIVAMDMKQRGLYLARQLSFSGTSFRVEEVALTKEFIHAYDESVKLWLETRRQFQLAADLVNADRTERKSMWGQFWSAHQRFFKYLCIASKVAACVKIAREAVKYGKCVVIGLQSTGEARTLEQLDECGGELNDFLSTAKSVFMTLIERHFPVNDSSKEGNRRAKFSLKNSSMDDFGQKPNRKRTFNDMTGTNKRRKVDKNSNDLFKNGFSNAFGDESNSIDEDSGSNNDKDEQDKGENSESDSENNSSSDENDEDEGDSADSSHSSSSGDEGNDEDDEEESDVDGFNPFADDLDDMWDAKIMRNKNKKQKKRSKSSKKQKSKEFDELGKQLEAALEEQKVKKTEVREIDAHEFLQTSSGFFEPNSDRYGSAFGMNETNMMKAELLAAVERLSDLLPPNTLDQLIDELGGPEYVAEMTGRKGRIVSSDDGAVRYELRNEDDVPLELINLAEKERFMNGTKHVAIISEAASSGISLQSDRRAKNQRRRVHITLELPWSADKAIQQFGRTHRSNQVNAPEYVFLISELAGEYRFASIVAKRLESLGALTHGDRRATESRDLSQFNLDTKYGRVALELVLKSILGYVPPPVNPPSDYKANFFQDMRHYMEGVGLAYQDGENGPWFIEKDVNISKFLNRILGLPVYAQNALFQYFYDTLKAVINEAKRDGRFDMGILDLGSGREQVKKIETRVFIGKFDAGGFRTELHLLSVERGLSWEEAMKIYTEHGSTDDGFYLSANPNVKNMAVLICAVGRRRLDTNERLYNIFRPNTGLNQHMETLNVLKHRYKRVLPEVAESVWKDQYNFSLNNCQHFYCYGKCRNQQIGLICEIGKRKRSYYILSGSVLSVWNTVEHVLCGFSIGRRHEIMQIVRVRTEKDQKIVGILIPNAYVRAVVDRLSEEASRTYLES